MPDAPARLTPEPHDARKGWTICGHPGCEVPVSYDDRCGGESVGATREGCGRYFCGDHLHCDDEIPHEEWLCAECVAEWPA